MEPQQLLLPRIFSSDELAALDAIPYFLDRRDQPRLGPKALWATRPPMERAWVMRPPMERAWVMPSHQPPMAAQASPSPSLPAKEDEEPATMAKEKDEMAKIDILIVNRDAPVEVWAYGKTDRPFKHFKNVDEFEKWYSPKMGSLGGRTTNDINSFMIRDPDAAPPSRPGQALPPSRDQLKKAARPTEPKPPGAPRAGVRGTPQQVEVKGKTYRSLLVAWTACGFPYKHHQKFRKELKAAGKLSWEGVEFKVVT